MARTTDRSGSSTSGPRGTRQRRCVQLLLERFPHVRAASLQLIEQQESFRELCEEYEACSDAADRLSHSAGDEALRREYNALRLRLEGELLRYISDHGGSDAPV